MITNHVVIPLISVMVTLSISIIVLFFKAGHLTARVEALEGWRPNIRNDMHEISENIDAIKNQVTELKTLLLERTERRLKDRP